MKDQFLEEISSIIIGVILILIGTVILGITNSGLVHTFILYVGGGFLLGGIIAIIGGALSLLHS